MLETLDIIRSKEIRTALARQVEDPMAKSVWMSAANLKESDFQTELESTMNRLGRFLSTQVLKLAFSQSNVSLDMRAVMQKNQIVVAALATEGSRVAEEDAAVVGSLLLNELWCAAKHLGKQNFQTRRFAVIIDEFQEYVSPVIARSLAQLRGMGVGFVMAHQSPQQLLDMGPVGREVLNAIVSNAVTQVIFQSPHPDDLDLLGRWIFGQTVNADAVKHQHAATKTLGHEIQYMKSYSQSRTTGTSRSANWSTSQSVSGSVGTSRSQSQATGTTRAAQQGSSKGTTSSVSKSTGHSAAESAAESVADGTTESQAASRSITVGTSETTGGSETESEAFTEGITTSPMLMPILGKEDGPPQFRSVEEQLFVFGQHLAAQPERHAIVRIGINPPERIVTPTVAPTRISAKGARAWVNMKLKKLEFALPAVEAMRRLEERRKLFVERLLGPGSSDEPKTVTRKITENPHG